MTRLNRAIYIILLAFLLISTSFGHAEAKARNVKKVLPDRYADIVIDADTGYILHSTNRNAFRHPASLTKMMTLYLVFQAIENGQIEMDTRLPVSALAIGQPPTKIGMRRGQTLRVYDAVMSLITKSANDSAVVLAEGIGGSVPRFVALMNKQAKALGMQRTVFQNPSGLPDKNQITSASDMAVLAQALIHHYPGFYPYFRQRSFTYGGQTMHNHNKLQESYEGMDGIKTGYTNASGFNLAASAMRGDTRLIGIVLGGKTAQERNYRMKSLLDASFVDMQRASLRQMLARGRPSNRHASFVSLPTKTDVISPTKHTQKKIVMALSPPQLPPVQKERKEWGLQIGAYSEIAGAEKILEETVRISGSLLDEAEQSLQKVTMTDGSTIYRARFLGIDQKTARAVCSHLIKNGQNCLVISGI